MKSTMIIFIVAVIGTIACAVSFGIALTRPDNLIAQTALGAAAFFCFCTSVTAYKKNKKK
ncbi:MAG: hypothetical protein K6B74_01400 [Ruminococcus sp.]|nr:hypothetical protein [Ruminococcus sp.]